MKRTLSFALLGVLLLTTGAFAADADGRISGRLVDIRPEGKLVIEEQGPWKGPGTGLVTRTVDLTPNTTIRVVRPTGRWDVNDSTPGYEVQTTDFTVLRTGDFVTAFTGGQRSSVAMSLDIMRLEGSDAGLAAPRLDSGR